MFCISTLASVAAAHLVLLDPVEEVAGLVVHGQDAGAQEEAQVAADVSNQVSRVVSEW